MGADQTNAAGASARREYERRRAADEAKVRAKWGRFGGFAVALTDERQSTTAWATGARGEQVVGAALDGVASKGVVILHDRRIPGGLANIDHLAATGAGVWVIDAKRYKDQRPSLVVEGGFVRPRVETLMVGRREQTKLVDGMLRQIDVVQQAVPEVRVHGVLCFVDADWPMFGGGFVVRGVEVCWPKRLVAKLSRGRGGERGRHGGCAQRTFSTRVATSGGARDCVTPRETATPTTPHRGAPAAPAGHRARRGGPPPNRG